MSTPFLLQKALQAHLTQSLAVLPLETKIKGRDGKNAEGEHTRTARVFVGDVPKRKAGQEEVIPFVSVHEQAGHTGDHGMTRTELLLRCAIFSEDEEDAAQELSNLVQSVRHVLSPLCQHPLDSRYRLLTDDKGRLLPWERPLEQPSPYAEAYILTTWEYKGFELAFAEGV